MPKLECLLCGEVLPNRSVQAIIGHLQTKHATELTDRIEAAFFRVVQEGLTDEEFIQQLALVRPQEGVNPLRIKSRFVDANERGNSTNAY